MIPVIADCQLPIDDFVNAPSGIFTLSSLANDLLKIVDCRSAIGK